jgi:hypothetical protein
MSRLCSSPEVTSLELQALSYKPRVIRLSSYKSLATSLWVVVVIVASPDPGTPHAHQVAVQFNSTQILPYVAVNKDALPNSPADLAGCIKSFRLPKQAQVFRVIFQAQ